MIQVVARRLGVLGVDRGESRTSERLWTRVQLPLSPLKYRYRNPIKTDRALCVGVRVRYSVIDRLYFS